MTLPGTHTDACVSVTSDFQTSSKLALKARTEEFHFEVSKPPKAPLLSENWFRTESSITLV